MEKSMIDTIREKFDLRETDIKTYSPLTLAFMGDCVFDLYIRSILVANGNRGVNGLHKDKSNLVKAKAQAEMAEALQELLNDDEKEIYRRGRNAKTASSAKNADMSDYHKATGFEALLGYLYLQGKEERLLELVSLAVAFYQK
ncbi:MAG: ribonuclease III [Lachnospiraceae bacterium]|nr:ribonuclease III [Lachnospiraceae bacterium]